MGALIANTRAALVTTALLVALLAAAHIVLGILQRQLALVGTLEPADQARAAALIFPWTAVVGGALACTAVIAFGGFALAAKRIRIGIAAAFLLTFLALLSFFLTFPEIGDSFGTDTGESIMRSLTTVVITVVAFYFGSEAIISGTKVWKIADVPGAAAGDGAAPQLPPRSPEGAFSAAQSTAPGPARGVARGVALSERGVTNQRRAILGADQDL